jgi:large subunit ribosomal protein L10e
MRKAFGKPIGLAARVYVGTVVMEISVMAEHLDKAKAAMKAAANKLPMLTKAVVVPLEKKMEAEAAA